MSNLIIPNLEGGLISGIGNNELKLPFENEIYLYTIEIAGLNYYVNEYTKVLEKDILKLQREENNEFDKYAILVYTHKDDRLGYIPKRQNRIFARLMDGGKMLYAKVKSVEYEFDYINKILIEIYLKDI